MTVTETATRADLAEVRRSLRDSAAEVEQEHLGELERRDVGRGAMQAPPPLERIPDRLMLGRFRSRGAEDYDWFYGLHKEEQERLRDNWFAAPGARGQAPSEVFEKVPRERWLEETRIIDASRAVGAGRAGQFNPKRYGGLDPDSLIADNPYKVRQVWSSDEEAARRHVARAQERGARGSWRERAWGTEADRSRCQFFTDENGVVHPICKTCPPGGAEPYDGDDTPVHYAAWELEEF